MTAPNHCVLEGTVGIAPRRPDSACEDMGGLQFQDAVGPDVSPNPNEHLSARDYKQVEMLLQRTLRMVPLLTVEVTATGSTHTLLSVTSAVDTLNSSNVTVTHNATGIFTIAWPASSLPPKTRGPHAYSTSSSSTVDSAYPQQGTNSVVVTTSLHMTGATTNFVTTYAVDIYGE